MDISRFVEPELNLYRNQCNFVGVERDVFEMRSRGMGLAEISEELKYTHDHIRKVSQEVNDKITRVQHIFSTF
jgi:hypothetical protein